MTKIEELRSKREQHGAEMLQRTIDDHSKKVRTEKLARLAAYRERFKK